MGLYDAGFDFSLDDGFTETFNESNSSFYIPTSFSPGVEISSGDIYPASSGVDFSFGDIGAFIKNGVDWGLGVQATINNARNSAEDAEFNRLMRTTGLDVARTQLSTQAEISKAQSTTDLAIAKAKLAAAQGAGAAGAAIAANPGGSLVLLLTILGVGFAAMSFAKGK